MKNKGANEVLRALEKFVDEVGDVKVLTSDQDKAFLSNAVTISLKLL